MAPFCHPNRLFAESARKPASLSCWVWSAGSSVMMTRGGQDGGGGLTEGLNDSDISNMLGRKCSTSPSVFRLTEPLACEIFMVAAARGGVRVCACVGCVWGGFFPFCLMRRLKSSFVRERDANPARGRPFGSAAAAGPMWGGGGWWWWWWGGTLVHSQAGPEALPFIPARWVNAAVPPG